MIERQPTQLPLIDIETDMRPALVRDIHRRILNVLQQRIRSNGRSSKSSQPTVPVRTPEQIKEDLLDQRPYR